MSKPLTNESLWRRLRVARRILGYTKEIGQLQDLIPICAYCRQVREDDHYWSNIEQYIQAIRQPLQPRNLPAMLREGDARL